MSVMTSREFNQDLARAKRSADTAPVIITDRGRPAYVLLRHDAYQALVVGRPNLLELIGMDDEAHAFDFEPPKLEGPLARPAEFD